MPALTTTQTFFDQHNMVQGSLSFLTIELKDPDNKYWKFDVTNGAGEVLIKGHEYIVKTANSAGDATDVGGAAAILVANDKFIADDGDDDNPAGTEIPFTAYTSAVVTSLGNGDAGLQKVIQGVSSRASIVYIGAADTAGTGYAGLTKVRLMIENAGYQNDEGMDHDRGVGFPKNDYTSGYAATLERYLNMQEGLDPDHPDYATDRKFIVSKFVF